MEEYKYDCMNCMEYRSGNCFGKKHTCKDFRYAPPMPKEPYDNFRNYTYGYKSYSEQIRLARQNDKAKQNINQPQQNKSVDLKNSQNDSKSKTENLQFTSTTQTKFISSPTILDKIDALLTFKSTLNSICNMINPFTYKVIYGIDDKLMSVIIDLKEYIGASLEVALKKYSNMNTPWTDEEEKQLKKEYADNVSIDKISKIHRRCSEEIYIRLKRLNIIN